MAEWIITSIIFQTPITCCISGPTGAGKTEMLKKILINKEALFDKQPDRIVFCYKIMQPAYAVFKMLDIPVEFIEGLPSENVKFDPQKNNILILDDLMAEIRDNSDMAAYFTRRSHHENISIFFLSQNIFMKGKVARDISLNCTNLITFNNPRDKVQIRYLGQQMFPKKTQGFMEIVNDAFSQPHGYLFFDFKQSTPDNMRIQTCIIPGENRIIYTLKD